MAKSNQGGGGLHSMRDQFWRDVAQDPSSNRSRALDGAIGKLELGKTRKRSVLFREHHRLHAGNFEALPAAHVLTGQ
jgi:hypothetical protein